MRECLERDNVCDGVASFERRCNKEIVAVPEVKSDGDSTNDGERLSLDDAFRFSDIVTVAVAFSESVCVEVAISTDGEEELLTDASEDIVSEYVNVSDRNDRLF